MLEYDFTKPWHEIFFGLKKPRAGDIGLEIEVELNRGYEHDNMVYWRVDKDGSLRGNGYEFILNGPIEEAKLDEALDEWKGTMRGYKWRKSPRTSVHVHLNMHRFTLPQILNFGIGYWLAEDWLLHFCGPSRKGNLFCLSNSRSDEIASDIKMWLRDNGRMAFRNLMQMDRYKYSGVNFCPLEKQGSIEIRSMRGIGDVDLMKLWTHELMRLRNFTTHFKNPEEMLKMYIKTPKEEWLKEIFSKEFYKEVSGLVKDESWKAGMDKAFYDFIQIVNAPKSWEYQKKQEKKGPLEAAELDPFPRPIRPAGAIFDELNAQLEEVIQEHEQEQEQEEEEEEEPNEGEW